jgi:ferredoxin/thioredoxin reductase
MAAARELRRWGHGVSVYESEALGGTLSTAIPDFRLSRAVIEARWRRLRDAGVEVHVPVRVGTDVPLEALLADHDAVLLATGCQVPVQLRLPGADLSRVYTGLEFMKAVGHRDPPPLGERVVVVGAGLVGLDCARSALRLGARSVVVIEIFSEQQMPYDPAERAVASEEGVEFLFEARVTRIAGRAAVEGVEVELRHGDGNNLAGAPTQFRPADAVIVAVGQRAALPRLGSTELPAPREAPNESPWQPAGWPAGLFVAGDALSGPSSVAKAIAAGRDAAAAIHTYLMATAPPLHANGAAAIPAWTAETLARRMYGGDDYDRLPRQPETSREVLADGSRRVTEVSYSAAVAQREAQRCLQCQLNVVLDARDCLLCGRCVEICPYGCLLLVDQDCIASIDGDGAAPRLAATVDWSDGAALVLDETACIRCGLCVSRCPNGCLSLESQAATPISVGLERLVAVG